MVYDKDVAKYQKKYVQENTKSVLIRFTKSELDTFEKLEKIPQKSTWIKKLIKAALDYERPKDK